MDNSHVHVTERFQQEHTNRVAVVQTRRSCRVQGMDAETEYAETQNGYEKFKYPQMETIASYRVENTNRGKDVRIQQYESHMHINTHTHSSPIPNTKQMSAAEKKPTAHL